MVDCIRDVIVWTACVSLYSGLNLNQYGVASPCRTICTVCGFVALSWFKFNPLYMRLVFVRRVICGKRDADIEWFGIIKRHKGRLKSCSLKLWALLNLNFQTTFIHLLLICCSDGIPSVQTKAVRAWCGRSRKHCRTGFSGRQRCCRCLL